MIKQNQIRDMPPATTHIRAIEQNSQKFNREYGPWNVQPREFVTSLKIVALVYDLKSENGDIEYEFELDYGNPEDRKFLGRLSFWAISNGRSVETLAVDEWNKMK